eukprot:symbB.v1.2.007530.t1/scaffold462.1/size201456/20
MDVGNEEYGLMMDAEIGIYAMRAQADPEEACSADGEWSKLLSRIQAFERRKAWPGARVSATLTKYNFGTYSKSGKDYDLHLLRENARYLVDKGNCKPGDPCQKVNDQLKKVIWTWWTELPIVRLDVAKRMLLYLSHQTGSEKKSWRDVSQQIFFPRFEHVVYQMWCMLYEGWDVKDVTDVTLEAKWGSYMEDPLENSQLAKLQPMWVSSEALSKAQSGKIMPFDKEAPPLILFHVDMLDLRYSAGGHDYKVLWEDLLLDLLKVHNRTWAISEFVSISLKRSSSWIERNRQIYQQGSSNLVISSQHGWRIGLGGHCQSPTFSQCLDAGGAADPLHSDASNAAEF